MYKKLLEIQSVIKSEKNEYNSFGKYSYRTAEGILDTVKPLLKEKGLLLTINDEMVVLGDRFYIKAVATITDIETKESTSVSAYAREAQSLKGQSEGQITGTTSSYARKYALAGLFCLSPAKDLDDPELHPNKPSAKPMPRDKKEDLLVELCDKKGKKVSALCAWAGVTEIAELSDEKLDECLGMLNR